MTEDRKIKLKSFSVRRNWAGSSRAFTAVVEIENETGEQKINLSDEQAMKILDASLAAVASSILEQNTLIAETFSQEISALDVLALPPTSPF